MGVDVPDAMLAVACLASAIVLVISARQREAGARPDRPWLDVLLGLFLFLCGAAQVARAIAGVSHRAAVTPITAGAACWAAAFMLRTSRRARPVVFAGGAGPAVSVDRLVPPVPAPSDSLAAGESAYAGRPDVAENPGNPRRRREPSFLPAGRRILIVDDEESTAEIMAMILRLEGHEVHLAGSVPAALKMIPGYRPEVVLSDIGLPGLDGHELARRIRRDPVLSDGVLLLAAVTGFADVEARHQSREAGFDHHLVKPVDPEAIIAMLASLEWQEPATRAAAVSPGE